ncbi:kinase-like domain-containing protein, partial [Usnea florida]
LGRGAWSTVYRAFESIEPLKTLTNLPPTPPTSPITGTIASSKKVLAVKMPSSRQAHKILEKEAKILTYIHSHASASTFVVPLHGFDSAQHSIVLDAVPLSLEVHAKAAIGRPLSTKTMFDPVIGAEEWAGLAEGLIDGLAHLHSVNCVHGDIKPANVLLRPGSRGELTPLYCDFSSSHIVSDKGEEEVEEVSAVTTEYLAPNLLEALSPRNPRRAVATHASDVFALGVTLLFAAIGESPYACARIASQKLGMAKEGTPFDFARRGEQASRLMQGRAVDRALKSALAKEAVDRVSGADW